MILMSEILGILMFVSDVFYAIALSLNSIVTLASNRGGAIL